MMIFATRQLVVMFGVMLAAIGAYVGPTAPPAQAAACGAGLPATGCFHVYACDAARNVGYTNATGVQNSWTPRYEPFVTIGWPQPMPIANEHVDANDAGCKTTPGGAMYAQQTEGPDPWYIGDAGSLSGGWTFFSARGTDIVGFGFEGRMRNHMTDVADGPVSGVLQTFFNVGGNPVLGGGGGFYSCTTFGLWYYQSFRGQVNGAVYGTAGNFATGDYTGGTDPIPVAGANQNNKWECIIDNSAGPALRWQWNPSEDIGLINMYVSCRRAGNLPPWTYCADKTFTNADTGNLDPAANLTKVSGHFFDVIVLDSIAPTVSLVDNGGTCLPNVGATVSTSFRACFSPDDNSGIRSAQVVVDGTTRYSQSYQCDFTYAAPCSNATNTRSAQVPPGDIGARTPPGLSAAADDDPVININGFAIGGHVCTIRVWDAGGNLGTTSCNFMVGVTAQCNPSLVAPIATRCPAAIVAGVDQASSDDSLVGITSPTSSYTPSGTKIPAVFSYNFLTNPEQGGAMNADKCIRIGPFTNPMGFTDFTNAIDLNQIVSVNVNLEAFGGKNAQGENRLQDTLPIAARQTDDYMFALGCAD